MPLRARESAGGSDGAKGDGLRVAHGLHRVIEVCGFLVRKVRELSVEMWSRSCRILQRGDRACSLLCNLEKMLGVHLPSVQVAV